MTSVKHTEHDSHSSFGADNNKAWLGTPNDSDNAYYVNSNGNVNNNNTSNSNVCAPLCIERMSYGIYDYKKVFVLRFSRLRDKKTP